MTDPQRQNGPSKGCPIKAVGINVIIVGPSALETTGSILIPDQQSQPLFYGRVLSCGPECKQVVDGDLVVYFKAGANDVEFEKFSKAVEARDFPKLVTVVEGMVHAIIDQDYAQEVMGLRPEDIKLPF